MIEVRADVEVHLWCSTRLGFMIKTPHCLHFEETFSILSYFMVVGFVKFSVVFFFLKGEIFIRCQFAAVVLYGLDTQYLVCDCRCHSLLFFTNSCRLSLAMFCACSHDHKEYSS